MAGWCGKRARPDLVVIRNTGDLARCKLPDARSVLLEGVNNKIKCRSAWHVVYRDSEYFF